ncbi:MAG: hypothetical protein WAW36_01695 [Methylovulum miyakonense]|uniref:hypothetical protein n=1 Tax=Methylovulum miyakonense TaxID=645578 RepID=UPI003BB52A50
MDYGNCATLSTNKIVTAEENGRKLTLNNPTQRSITKVQVDGCLPIPVGKRCDYLFEIGEPATLVIYLELKGCDIPKAYEQLTATIDLFRSKHDGCKKICHIVASRVPKAGPETQQLKIKLLKTKQAELIVNTNQAFVNV